MRINLNSTPARPDNRTDGNLSILKARLRGDSSTKISKLSKFGRCKHCRLFLTVASADGICRKCSDFQARLADEAAVLDGRKGVAQ